MMTVAPKSIALRLALTAALAVAGGISHADTAVIDDPNAGFSQQTGEQLYHAICLGCHMAEGEGATGAGTYPALADNPKLVAAGYPLYIVTYGQKGMPAFGGRLSDQQIADVVNYVRSHFGNNYEAVSTAADVEKLRVPGYDYVTLE